MTVDREHRIWAEGRLLAMMSEAVDRADNDGRSVKKINGDEFVVILREDSRRYGPSKFWFLLNGKDVGRRRVREGLALHASMQAMIDRNETRKPADHG